MFKNTGCAFIIITYHMIGSIQTKTRKFSFTMKIPSKSTSIHSVISTKKFEIALWDSIFLDKTRRVHLQRISVTNEHIKVMAKINVAIIFLRTAVKFSFDFFFICFVTRHHQFSFLQEKFMFLKRCYVNLWRKKIFTSLFFFLSCCFTFVVLQ